VSDKTLGFLNGFLWVVFVLSVLSFPIGSLGVSMDEIAEHNMSLAREYRGEPKHHENWYPKKLGREINPHGAAPILMVLSAGFLAVIRVQQLAAAASVAAIRESHTPTGTPTLTPPATPPPIPKPAAAVPAPAPRPAPARKPKPVPTNQSVWVPTPDQQFNL